jgi:nucleoside-diphosphate-sugar epimerase
LNGITTGKKVLGWEPKVEFEEGIKKTIDYFREHLKSSEKS